MFALKWSWPHTEIFCPHDTFIILKSEPQKVLTYMLHNIDTDLLFISFSPLTDHIAELETSRQLAVGPEESNDF